MRSPRKKKYILIGVGLVVGVLIFASFLGDLMKKKERGMNAVVILLHSAPEVSEWLRNPGKAYVEGYFSFPADLADDVSFGLDVEFWEGKENPVYRSEGDWMGTAFLSRGGLLVISAGDSDYKQGYAAININATLLPNVWYRMHLVIDFDKRKFVSFNITGPDVEKTVDLKEYNLSLPQQIPMNRAALTFYVGAAKLSDHQGTNIVYADDVEGGIEIQGLYRTVLKNGFENQNTILEWPKDTYILSNWTEAVWYKEWPNAKVSIEQEPTHTDHGAISLDASKSA